MSTWATGVAPPLTSTLDCKKMIIRKSILWPYAIALISAIGVALYFQLPRFPTALLLGAAFCVGIYVGELVNKWVGIGLLLYAGILLIISYNRSIAYGYSIIEMFLIKQNTFYKLMPGFYACIIGALFIFVVQFKK